MSNEPTQNGTSRETLKWIIKGLAAVLMLFVALNAFLAKEIFFGDHAKGGTQEPNVALLKMFEKQVENNGKLVAATEIMAQAADRMASASETANRILENLTSNLDKAMKRQVTKEDLEKLSGEIKESSVKSKK